MNVCVCCGQEVSNGLRPPDSRGNGTLGWRISYSDSFSEAVDLRGNIQVLMERP